MICSHHENNVLSLLPMCPLSSPPVRETCEKGSHTRTFAAKETTLAFHSVSSVRSLGRVYTLYLH